MHLILLRLHFSHATDALMRDGSGRASSPGLVAAAAVSRDCLEGGGPGELWAVAGDV